MAKPYARTARQYNGTQVTTRRMADLLPAILAKIGGSYKQRGDLVLAAWPTIIGPQLAVMAQAVSFVDGTLCVKVKNSTLLSVLSQHEKLRLLKMLRGKFPDIEIRNIHFRIG